MCHGHAAMVHRSIWRVFVDRLPLAAAEIERKREWRRLRGLAVISDSIVVVGVIRAPGEVDPIVFLGCDGSNSITCRTRVLGHLGPFDLRYLGLVDFSHPALVRSQILWIRTVRILVRAIDVDNGVSGQRSGVAENWSAGDRCPLHPSSLFYVIDLNVTNRIGLGPSSDEVNVTITVDAEHEVIDRNRNVVSPIPQIQGRNVDVHVGDGGLPSVAINRVTAQQNYLTAHGNGAGGNTARGPWYGAHLLPFSVVEIQLECLICDRIPRFLGTDTHERENLGLFPAVHHGYGVVRERDGERTDLGRLGGGEDRRERK